MDLDSRGLYVHTFWISNLSVLRYQCPAECIVAGMENIGYVGNAGAICGQSGRSMHRLR